MGRKAIPVSFTLEEKARKILAEEVERTGKSRSFIVRELIWDLGKKQQSQNEK
ncbi:ribbon-helix-helix protein, CopG family, partial [Planktothrix sp.]|uniref:ribbon-helix-helix protein, CopG family n=1 Tax=Planktothrix sp. TaxID=3088171 RepID=UPI0038D35A15